MRAVNLLPSDLRGTAPAPVVAPERDPEPRSSGPYLVLAALALALLAVVGYVLVANDIRAKERELADVTNRAQSTLAAAAPLKPYADFEALATQRIDTVRTLAGVRFDWEQALRDLSRALPEGVTLKSLTGSISPNVGGVSGSTLRASRTVPAIELAGCTSSQTSVARVMARLRGVDGVTRVSLASADKDGSGTPTADNANASQAKPTGTASLGNGCGADGKRPDFTLVMFFERAAAAAVTPGTASTGSAAAGTSAAAGATPTATATATPAAGATATATPTPSATP
jgi:Tfp pilus assembly protein PilN